jgi:hypothetical protein
MAENNKKYTKQQKKNLTEKWVPRVEREYIVTDSCYWETTPPEDYNPHDTKRAPHSIQLVDQASGTIVNLPSGSVIKVVSVYGTN